MFPKKKQIFKIHVKQSSPGIVKEPGSGAVVEGGDSVRHLQDIFQHSVNLTIF